MSITTRIDLLSVSNQQHACVFDLLACSGQNYKHNVRSKVKPYHKHVIVGFLCINCVKSKETRDYGNYAIMNSYLLAYNLFCFMNLLNVGM